jgi:hypothetical protein
MWYYYSETAIPYVTPFYLTRGIQVVAIGLFTDCTSADLNLPDRGQSSYELNTPSLQTWETPADHSDLYTDKAVRQLYRD